MAAIEERVALLEGRMIEQAQLFAEIRETRIVGIRVTTLIAVVAALLGAFSAR